MQNLIAERGSADGCSTFEDIVERYDLLDEIFVQVVREQQLRSNRELNRIRFRAWGEVYVHVGRGPRLIFGGGGCHRLAAARIVGLDCIPAQIGVVHHQHLHDWSEVATPRADRPSACIPPA